MQILMNGIITGLTIAMLAVAFSVVYLPMRVFHIALGGVFAIVPFVAWVCLREGWSWYLAVVSASLMGIGLFAGM